jgi:hypothetical protein
MFNLYSDHPNDALINGFIDYAQDNNWFNNHPDNVFHKMHLAPADLNLHIHPYIENRHRINRADYPTFVPSDPRHPLIKELNPSKPMSGIRFHIPDTDNFEQIYSELLNNYRHHMFRSRFANYNSALEDIRDTNQLFQQDFPSNRSLIDHIVSQLDKNHPHNNMHRPLNEAYAISLAVEASPSVDIVKRILDNWHSETSDYVKEHKLSLPQRKTRRPAWLERLYGRHI